MPRLKKSDFTFLIKSAKKRIAEAKKKGRKIKFNLTENYLRKQFETQEGLCPCCGMELDLKGRSHKPGVPPDMRASVDRIVPADGYIRGNVALLHQCCNRFKGQLDGNMVYAIAKRIVELFEKTHPNTTVTIDTNLRDKDGRKYVYPRYSYVGSGSIGKLGGTANVTVKPSYSADDADDAAATDPQAL